MYALCWSIHEPVKVRADHLQAEEVGNHFVGLQTNESTFTLTLTPPKSLLLSRAKLGSKRKQRKKVDSLSLVSF